MARLHGRSGAIGIAASITPEGSPADLDFTVVGSLRAWSLSFSRPTFETTTIRSSGKTFLPGLEDVAGSFDGTFDTDYVQTVIASSADADAVWIRITPSTDYPELFFQGSAWVSVNLAGVVNDGVRLSGTFTGNGVWQKSYAA